MIGGAGNPCWAYACYGRKVESAALEIVAHGRENESSELELPVVVEALMEATVIDGYRTALDAFQQRDETGPYSSEQRGEFRNSGPRLVGIQQRVLG